MPEDVDFAVGTIIRGKYQVLGRLGEGGMAVVYKVRHLILGRTSALKVMSQSLLALAENDRDDFILRFRQEAELSSRVNHPNAVRVYDFDQTDDGRFYIEMEYIEGISLEEHLTASTHPVSHKECMAIATQVAAALRATHAGGVVHRDIKPSNVLLSTNSDGTVSVKVADFGIAKALEQTSLTRYGQVIGTPDYMPPERFSMDHVEEVDGRTDIFALGIILYRLAVGTHPFQGNPAARRDPSLRPTTQSLARSLKNSGARSGVQAIILKCLHENPDNRFQSANEMLRALQAVKVSRPRMLYISAGSIIILALITWPIYKLEHRVPVSVPGSTQTQVQPAPSPVVPGTTNNTVPAPGDTIPAPAAAPVVPPVSTNIDSDAATQTVAAPAPIDLVRVIVSDTIGIDQKWEKIDLTAAQQSQEFTVSKAHPSASILFNLPLNVPSAYKITQTQMLVTGETLTDTKTGQLDPQKGTRWVVDGNTSDGVHTLCVRPKDKPGADGHCM